MATKKYRELEERLNKLIEFWKQNKSGDMKIYLTTKQHKVLCEDPMYRNTSTFGGFLVEIQD